MWPTPKLSRFLFSFRHQNFSCRTSPIWPSLPWPFFLSTKLADPAVSRGTSASGWFNSGCAVRKSPGTSICSYHSGARAEGREDRAKRTHKSVRFRRIVFLAVAVGGSCITILYTQREIVPYTYRHHFVLIPPDLETSLAGRQFEALKEEWKPLILPPFHPVSIRVRRIARDIIKAVIEGIQIEEPHSMKYEDDVKRGSKAYNQNVLSWQRGVGFPISTEWGRKDDLLDDDRWMDKCREKGLRRGSRPFVEHLHGMKWEVIVVDKDAVNAFCLPGGKIVVYTGLLKHFPYDEEIATILGHEIGHVVARHNAERMTRHLYVTLAQLFVLAFFPAPNLVQSASILFLELPFSRRQELEADHIGMLLMAAAGYDPRFAPLVYESLGKLSGTVVHLLEYVTTHPSGKKRGRMLNEAGSMEEALKIYREKTRGNVVEGFLWILE